MSKLNPHIILNPIQREALIGNLLGDGHIGIHKSASNAFLSITRSSKDADYLEYERQIFYNLLSPKFKNNIKKYNIKDAFSNKQLEVCGFRTENNSSITEYQKIWYKDKIKTVPSDLQLSARTIAHWLADDGSVSYNKLPYRFQIEFSTHSFSKDEVYFLSSLLSDRYHEQFKVQPKHRGSKTWYIIKAYDSACRTMIQDIDQYFFMQRKRLWDKLESRYYNDPPERQIEKQKLFQERKDLIKSILEENKIIKLSELTKLLGYKSNISTNILIAEYLKSKEYYKFLDKYDNNTCYIIRKGYKI